MHRMHVVVVLLHGFDGHVLAILYQFVMILEYAVAFIYNFVWT